MRPALRPLASPRAARRRLTAATFGLALSLAATASPAVAAVAPGSVAPNFTKNEVGAPAPAARSLSDYAGKVVVLFLLGYS